MGSQAKDAFLDVLGTINQMEVDLSTFKNEQLKPLATELRRMRGGVCEEDVEDEAFFKLTEQRNIAQEALRDNGLALQVTLESFLVNHGVKCCDLRLLIAYNSTQVVLSSRRPLFLSTWLKQTLLATYYRYALPKERLGEIALFGEFKEKKRQLFKERDVIEGVLGSISRKMRDFNIEKAMVPTKQELMNYPKGERVLLGLLDDVNDMTDQLKRTGRLLTVYKYKPGVVMGKLALLSRCKGDQALINKKIAVIKKEFDNGTYRLQKKSCD